MNAYLKEKSGSIKLSEKLMEKHGNIRCIVNLEMQVLDEGNWNERGVYYLAENLLDLKKGRRL